MTRKHNRRREGSTARLLLPLVRQHRWALPAVVALGVLSSLAEGVGITMFIPLLQTATAPDGEGDGGWLSRTFEGVFGGWSDQDRLLLVSLLIFGTIVLRAVLLFASQVLFAWFNARVGHDLRTRFHEHLIAVDYDYVERTDAGRLLNALSNETWSTTDALSHLARLVINSLTMCVYVGLLFVINWKLAVLVGVVMVVISWLVRFITRHVAQVSDDLTAENSVLAARMLDGCGGAKVIRLFGKEDDERARFRQSSWSVARLVQRMTTAQSTVAPIYELLAGGLLVALLYSSLRDSPGSLPSLLVFIVLLYRLQPQMRQVDEMRVELSRAAGAVREVARMMDPDDKPFTSGGEVDASTLEPSFRFQHVSFRYSDTEPLALDDVTMTIPPYRTTALVGPSGAGKSTLIDMLVRMRVPDKGSIWFGDVPLEELDLVSLRRSAAVVGQDTYLFNDTARANISYARPEVGDDAIERAARLANAHEFLARLPDGYDTVLGDDGVRLSGGQRQRIALARAIICEPAVLILDEATNALDSIAEAVIQDALDVLSEGRTVVVIAHRLATVRDADHVIVLDRGAVVEQGTPGELMANDGLFAMMNHLQQTALP